MVYIDMDKGFLDTMLPPIDVANNFLSKENSKIVNDLRKGRGITETKEDGRTMRDAWVHKIMQDAANAIEQLSLEVARWKKQSDDWQTKGWEFGKQLDAAEEKLEKIKKIVG